MLDILRVLRATCLAFAAAALVAGCGGSSTALPGLPGGTSGKAVRHAAAAANADVVAIDSGGAAAGSFSADSDFSADGTWTYATGAAIDTSLVSAPAPQAVYQTEREGASIAYTIAGLTPGAAYTVRLSFSELWWTADGQRTFNVSINNTSVLKNFDIFATAGARDKAITEAFAATANASGAIAVTFSAVTNYAAINAIEIIAGGSPGPTPTPAPAPTTTPTAAPATVLDIDAGGAAADGFSADTDYSAAGTWTYTSPAAVSTTGVTNPAPQAVYQSQRTGSTIAYTIPGLHAGTSYTVKLDFAELYWTAAGQRVFNVSINNVRVLSSFDIVAATGGRDRAVAETFTAVAAAGGSIAISLTALTNDAVINGIEISSGSGSAPTPAPTASFNDYVTFGYDNGRDVFNPNSTAITPASLPQLHLAWQASLADYNTQTQPILATEIPGHAGVLFVGGGTGNVYAYDALSGALIWTAKTGQMAYSNCGGTSYFGIGGSAAYDPASKSLYIVGTSNTAVNAYSDVALFHLDATTGVLLGKVDVTPSAAGPSEQNFGHTSVTLDNGIAYVGTSSTCDISSWRGRIAAVNVPAMTIATTFFPVWDPQNTRGQGAQPWGGGGIWGWGGVALDANGNVLTGVGNTDNYSPNGTIVAPFVGAPTEYSGYGESLLELSPGATSVIADTHPIPTSSYNATTSNDLDVQGTPLVFTPGGAGCGTLVALQGKSGELNIYAESRIAAGYVAQYQLSPSTYDDGYIGDPAYSPATGLLYADVASSVSPTLFAPGLIAVNPGCGSPSVTWHAAFGSDSSAAGVPRAVPAPSAGGVVFAGTVNGDSGELWAINAATGSVLNGGAPLLQTSGNLRVPPTIDGKWVFVMDQNGDLYGLTIDAAYPAITPKVRAVDARAQRHWASPHARAGS